MAAAVPAFAEGRAIAAISSVSGSKAVCCSPSIEHSTPIERSGATSTSCAATGSSVWRIEPSKPTRVSILWTGWPLMARLKRRLSTSGLPLAKAFSGKYPGT